MKERISVTLDKDIVETLNSLVEKRKYRNRSHVVEMAVEQFKKLEVGKSKK